MPGNDAGAFGGEWMFRRWVRELPPLKVERQNNKRIGMPARCREGAPSTPRRTRGKRAEEALRGVTIQDAKAVHPLGDHPAAEDAKLAETSDQCPLTGIPSPEHGSTST